MHLAFLTRGHIDHVENFIRELRTKYLDYPIYDPQTKEMKKTLLKIRLSPIQLWDLSFPKSSWDSVARTVLGDKQEVISPLKAKQFKLAMLRKSLGFKKIPEYKKDLWLPMSFPEHIEIHGIGVKDDYWITEDGKHVKEKDKTPLSREGI